MSTTFALSLCRADLLINALEMLNNAVRPDDFVNLWPESPISYEALYGPGLTRPAARALMPNTERSVAAARSTCQAWNAHANARLYHQR